MAHVDRFFREEILLAKQEFTATTTKTRFFIKFGMKVEMAHVKRMVVKNKGATNNYLCEIGILHHGQDYPQDYRASVTPGQSLQRDCDIPMPGDACMYIDVTAAASTTTGVFVINGEIHYKRELQLPGRNIDT